MFMAGATTAWTADDLEKLPDDGNRYEVVDGELFVTPSPSFSHQGIVMALAVRLRAYVRQHHLGHAFGSPLDVRFSKRDQVEPDVLVVPVQLITSGLTVHNAPKPILVVEVLSPSTFRRDLGPKRDLYRRGNVPEYWIVDGAEREVTVCRPGAPDRTVSDSLVWSPQGAPEPLTIPLAEFFAEAFGEES